MSERSATEKRLGYHPKPHRGRMLGLRPKPRKGFIPQKLLIGEKKKGDVRPPLGFFCLPGQRRRKVSFPRLFFLKVKNGRAAGVPHPAIPLSPNFFGVP